MGKTTINQLIRHSIRIATGKGDKYTPKEVVDAVKNTKIKVTRVEGGLPGNRAFRRKLRALHAKGKLA